MAPDQTIFPIVAEKFIQKAILDYLGARGYVCWRNNSGVFRPENKDGSRRFFRAGAVGTGDILGLTKTGRFFTIEVKRKGAKPTPDQAAFMFRVTASGGLAILAYSVDDVIKFL
jgi:hypothetical protein